VLQGERGACDRHRSAGETWRSWCRPRVTPLTESAAGRAVRKPNAAGGAALSALPSGLVAL
jgi:hypothetical protein